MTTSFIGLGAMGYPMASRLAQRMAAGGRILVHDASEERMKSFVAAHRGAAAAMVDAATATAAAAAAAQSTAASMSSSEQRAIVVLSLPGGEEVEH